MLYVFCGTDRERSYQKWTALASDFAEKKKARLFRVNPLSFSREAFEGFLRGQSLFEKKYVVAASTLFENEDAKEFILSHAEDLAKSPNVFLFFEDELSSIEKKELEKYADKLIESKLGEGTVGGFNMYSLTDALGARDRKKLWVLYQKALLEGVSDEEIFWKLGWHVRNMLEVSHVEPGASKLKPYVYDKTFRQVKNFSREEIENLHAELGRVYHETRSEGKDFDLALESFILSI